MCQELAGSLCGAAAANVEGSMPPENCSVLSGGESPPTFTPFFWVVSVLRDAPRAVATGLIGGSPHEASSGPWTGGGW